MITSDSNFIQAIPLAELQAAGRVVVHFNGYTVLLVAEDEQIYAVDNRCPHMGFPLDRGTVCDGLLALPSALFPR